MKEIIRFSKMHGAGNDYIYVNALELCPENLAELSIKMSDRHKGVGADGLVVILPSAVADFKMRMFNADGSEGKMCGNASRCVAKYVYDKKLISKQNITLETLSGVKQMWVHLGETGMVDKVTVDMGAPIFEPNKIPVAIQQKEIINFKIDLASNVKSINCISMGNPHCVIFGDCWEDADVFITGPKIENNETLFPDRINVEFASVNGPKTIALRVWERGSGETMACGTGACAAAVAAMRNNLCERRVIVHLLGGDLEISWDEATNHVMMTGDAHFVFEGEYEILSNDI